MRRVALAMLALLASGCDDDPGAAPGTGDRCGDLISQCPAGSNPLVGVQAEAGCSSAVGGIVSDGMGRATAQCVGAGSCRVLCQFAVPCQCGVASVTAAGVVCADCEGAASCGNGLCEGGESPETCAIDCGGRCEAGERRCDGERLQECSLQQRWDTLPCPDGDVCLDEGAGAACVRDPEIIGGDDAGVGADLGGLQVDGRIVEGDVPWPPAQPATRGTTPVQLVETTLPGVLQAGLGEALGDIGGHIAWRLVPDADQVRAVGGTGFVTAGFDGVPVEPVAFTADAEQYCLDYATCYNSPPPEDCAALVERERAAWGDSTLQCMAERIRMQADDPGACAVLFLGEGCPGKAVLHPDDAVVGAPARLVGDRLVGFDPDAQITGVLVDLAARTTATLGPVGELRLRAQATTLSVSADGRRAAYVAFDASDETIVLWDLDTTERRLILPASDPGTIGLALRSDGRVLSLQRSRQADPLLDDSLSLWDVESEARIFSILPPEGERFLLHALSPDGHTLAALVRPSNTVEIWDLAARTKRHTLAFQDETIPDALDFSPDGRLLAVRYSNFDRALTLWDVAGGQRVYTRAATSLGAFGTDGRILLVPERLAVDGLIILADP